MIDNSEYISFPLSSKRAISLHMIKLDAIRGSKFERRSAVTALSLKIGRTICKLISKVAVLRHLFILAVSDNPKEGADAKFSGRLVSAS